MQKHAGRKSLNKPGPFQAILTHTCDLEHWGIFLEHMFTFCLEFVFHPSALHSWVSCPVNYVVCTYLLMPKKMQTTHYYFSHLFCSVVLYVQFSWMHCPLKDRWCVLFFYWTLIRQWPDTPSGKSVSRVSATGLLWAKHRLLRRTV